VLTLSITIQLDYRAAMAPTFDTLSDHDFDDVDEEDIDFSGKSQPLTLLLVPSLALIPR